LAWTDRRLFQGLPSPAAAGGIAAMVWSSTHYGIDGPVALVAGISMTAAMGVLMGSRFSYQSLKGIQPSQKLRYTQLLLIPLIFIVLAIEVQVTSFILFVLYAASGPVTWFWRRRRRGRL
jgi:CDP-diacylglycerol--serine O-phosphatidyltransferase